MMNVAPSILIPDEQWEAFPPAARAIIIRLGARITALEDQVADLQARLSRNSTNSSKPPSTERPKLQKRKAKTGKPRGGVPGHEAHFRELAPPERVDHTRPHYPSTCRGCGHALTPAMAVGEPLLQQVTELPVVRADVTEHQLYHCVCPACRVSTTAELPEDVPPYAFGPRFTAFVALLVGRFRLSRREAAQLIGTMSDVTIAPSTVVKLCERVSEALEAPVEAIAAEVRKSPVAYVDETGSYRAGKLTWLWVAVAATATLFQMADTRSRAARKELLGDYHGIVVSDRYGAYNDIPAYDRGICHAHLKRDLVGLIERGGTIGHVAGVVREEQKRMFKLYWARERGETDQAEVLRKLAPLKARLIKVLRKAKRGRKKGGWALFKAMWKLWPALFTFVEVAGVEGTNSKAERALRPAVIWRRTSMGTDSVAGDRFAERMLSVSATCCQRNVNLFSYLSDAVSAHFKGCPAVLVPHAP